MQKLLTDLKSFYKTQGRHALPWRQTRDPYHILVSEIMLQQTQVTRVLPKYEEFLKEFPTAEALAEASLSKVLGVWSGLGYNRRGKFLHEAAKKIVTEHGGKVPRNIEKIAELPGVGPYTARAVAAFAFNAKETFVETNIRTVFIHYGFKNRRKLDSLISDAEIMPLVARALFKSRMSPRDFYAALMDYGSYLKQKGIKLNIKSKHYTKQSKFKGSERELRGVVLRELLAKPMTADELIERTGRTKTEVARVLAALSSEGMITLTGRRFGILNR